VIFAACAAFTLAVLVYIFWAPAELQSVPEKTQLTYLRERKEAVYENLRDLNFEYKAGKMPEADYESMKTSLEEEAATLLSEMDLLEGAPLEVPRAATVPGKGGRV
jgi:type II secretory pathway component PulM